jgi:outer membrane protein assembly factor BamA
VCFATLLLLLHVFPQTAYGQTTGELRVDPPPDVGAVAGRPIASVAVKMLGPLWHESVTVRSVKPGDLVSGAVVRRALRELDRTGRYADLRAELVDAPLGPILILWVRPRRLVQQVRIEGGALDHAVQRRALGLAVDDAVTDLALEQARERLIRLYAESGYPEAEVLIDAQDVDDPRRVLVRVDVRSGPAQEMTRLRVLTRPSPHHPRLSSAIRRFRLGVGDRLDDEAIKNATEELQKQLVQDRFYEAVVSYRILPGGVLEVLVASGRRYTLRFEGNETFGPFALSAELALDDGGELEPSLLVERLKKFYIQHGFLDVTATVHLLSDEAGLRGEIVVWIQEGDRFQIARRLYPCLSGNRDPSQLDKEVDGVLSEYFPETTLIGPVSPDDVDSMIGSKSETPQPVPYRATPWKNYSAESHRVVIDHLQDLYRSDGYLDATVGPATVVRRRCRRDSPPGQCLVEGPPPIPSISCEEPLPGSDQVYQTCQPDPERGVRCEAEATLVLPIFAGRQAVLYDVAIEGNRAFSTQDLLKRAKLPIGKALRRSQLDAGLRRISEHYEEQAYAFSQVDSEIELSADRTRAKVLISITERHRVIVDRIDVRGAIETSESLIRSRIALREDEEYRLSLVRRTQERVESLGVFTSVTVGLEDPGVPAKRKTVVVTVSERLPQYLDTKGGFGSADGFRIGFEYGHRNLGGEAIHLILRSQLAFRPLFLIAESDVRDKYQELSGLQRLERRNTITLGFPDIGLGPLFGFEVELLDLLSNERDFSHTRDAAVVRLSYRPRRQYLVQLGGTVELNDAIILGGQSLNDYAAANPSANIRVPDGRSVAYTQNLGGSWDRRDRPLSATRGTYIGGAVEHVTAVPLGQSDGTCNEQSTEVFDPVCSELLRFSAKVAGYIPFNKKGLALAVSLRAGVIQHLTSVSKTYPDRLFFMGGVDTLRGYTQYSLVPQDLADLVLNPNNDITIDEIVLRGGDIFINPRVELRVPITKTVSTAFFVDSGNLWADRSKFAPYILRYTTGTGLRVSTPVGPLVFDYGFNVNQLYDMITNNKEKERPWEPIGAFHFSIGLF